MKTRRRRFPGLVVGLALATLTACASPSSGCGEAGLERVRLDSGPVVGAYQDVAGQKIWSFKGIPYAAPPVGDLRWREPRPVASWTKPLDCTEFGAACPQPGMFEMFSLAAGPTKEDCLYLNVWSPAESAKKRLPVMVWIHGGSFETGAGSMEIYDGRHLAAKGVVVVTINYRLGPFGFLAHPALSAEAETGASGNYGLLDQIAALEWVQTNIAGFGGDPDNVTVFGESAGAMSILDLLVSPPAEGLFHRAIVESGIMLDRGFGLSTTATLEETEAAGEEFAEKLGIEASGDLAAQMRAKTPEELLAVADEISLHSDAMERILMWKPVVDGYVLPDLPTRLWAAGRQQRVSLLIGSNADEGNLFLASLTMSRARYEARVRGIFGDYADEALALFPVGGMTSATSAMSRVLTEVGFASTARFAARAMSADGSATYLYEFTRVPSSNPLGAFHAVEIPYVFGTADLFAGLGIVQQADRDLSATIMGFWTRFAATGDPNGEGAPTWPEYEEASDLHLELGDTVDTGSGLYEEACDLADRVRGLE